MKIQRFSADRNEEVKKFVLDVLAEAGFQYDPIKDFDLDDIHGYYLDHGGMFFTGIIYHEVMGTSAVRQINDDNCEIKRIYVKKEFRGRGYGKELFLQALDFAKDHYNVITLKTDRSLVEAVNMYLKSGFSIIKREDDTLFFSYNG